MSKNSPYTFDTLLPLIEDAPGKAQTGIVVRPNTTAYYEDDYSTFRVFLYGSQIAELYRDGSVRLHRRGHRSNTTRNRMDDVLRPLGWRLKIVDSEWRLVTTHPPYKSMEFIDDMLLTRITNAKDI